MRNIAYLIILLALAGCAKTSHPIAIAPSAARAFTVDQFVAVVMEYSGSRALVGADTHGPTAKEEPCARSAAAAMSQGDVLPKGHKLVTTCLHVKFAGPLPSGAAIQTPVSGTPFEYLTIGVEYAKAGDFVGAQALHPAPDAKTCMHEARDVIDSNYKDGHIAAGNSLLLYCLPVPVIDTDSKSEGGIV